MRGDQLGSSGSRLAGWCVGPPGPDMTRTTTTHLTLEVNHTTPPPPDPHCHHTVKINFTGKIIKTPSSIATVHSLHQVHCALCTLPPSLPASLALHLSHDLRLEGRLKIQTSSSNTRSDTRCPDVWIRDRICTSHGVLQPARQGRLCIWR